MNTFDRLLAVALVLAIMSLWIGPLLVVSILLVCLALLFRSYQTPP